MYEIVNDKTGKVWGETRKKRTAQRFAAELNEQIGMENAPLGNWVVRPKEDPSETV